MAAAVEISMSREWTRQLIEGGGSAKLTRPTRERLRSYLAAQGRGADELGRGSEATPIYGAADPRAFTEHVLYTAGRIAELAERIHDLTQQIDRASRKQLGFTRDLNQRASVEPVTPQEADAGVAADRQVSAKLPAKPRQTKAG